MMDGKHPNPEHSTFSSALPSHFIRQLITLKKFRRGTAPFDAPGKKAEHSFFLDFFACLSVRQVTFFVKKKSKARERNKGD
jgi:hypothetical protein